MDGIEMLDTNPLSFLWIELTNRCNLHCIHCYANSSPSSEETTLAEANYFQLIEDASSLGCRRVQFIGGEPTLNRSLPHYISHARKCGMEFIEVYTNARHISEELLASFIEHQVHIAASFYSIDERIHDSITRVPGSQRATAGNLHKFVHAHLRVRVGIIEMSANKNLIPETVEFIKNIGVADCGVDRVRRFGRGATTLEEGNSELADLCGSCWQGSLCVHPSGETSPCIMSRKLIAGSVQNTPLADIVKSGTLREFREQIYREVWLPGQSASSHVHNDHSHYTEADCFPNCNPTCHPRCSPSCEPCWPFNRCRPQTGSWS